MRPARADVVKLYRGKRRLDRSRFIFVAVEKDSLKIAARAAFIWT